MLTHRVQWEQIKSAFHKNRISQAMLLVGPLHCVIPEFVIHLIQLLFCKQDTNKPCYQCNECIMVKHLEHPDNEWIRPEKEGGAIKIEQIRSLHNSAFLTPQRAHYKIIIIDSADRMNAASANALLKIVEEPAKHMIFILIAQQISTILPTILSRCHIIPFSSQADFHTSNLLHLGSFYPEKSARALISEQAEPILDNLIAVLEQKEHPCFLAAQWSQFELSTLLWFLYLTYAQLQYMHATSCAIAITDPAAQQLKKLVSLLNPVDLFNQINKINTLLKKLNHNINVNNVLVIEDLLFSLKNPIN